MISAGGEEMEIKLCPRCKGEKKIIRNPNYHEVEKLPQNFYGPFFGDCPLCDGDGYLVVPSFTK